MLYHMVPLMLILYQHSFSTTTSDESRIVVKRHYSQVQQHPLRLQLNQLQCVYQRCFRLGKSCNSDENNRLTMERVARENESGTRERGAPWRIGRPVFTVDTAIRGRGTIGSHGAKRTQIGIKVERQGTRPRIEIGRVAQGEYGVSEGVPSAQV